MKCQRVSSCAQSEAGFSLVELLVSMAIALVIMAAAFSAYLGSADAGKVAEAQSRMNEDAQAALAILVQQIRMAGNNPLQPNRVAVNNVSGGSLNNPVYGVYNGAAFVASSYPPTTGTTSNFIIKGCDGTFSNPGTAASLDTLNMSVPNVPEACVAGTGAAGTATWPDSIAVNYEADRFNTNPTAAGLATDCVGNALPLYFATVPTIVAGTSTMAVVTYTVADNRFYIATSAAVTAPTLYCKGNAGTAAPLVENIVDMQFLYGTTNDATTATVSTIAGYLTATQVTALAPATNPELAWRRVKSVRVCVVARSEAPVARGAALTQYLDCDGNVASSTDNRLRRAYTTTVVLRNRQN